MKTITVDNYEAYIIDFVENTLSSDLNQEMLTLLNLHPDIADEVLQFRNLKITPDHSITFDGKADLIKPESGFRISQYLRPFMIAASLLLTVAVAGWFLCSEEQNSQKLVDVESPVKYKSIEESINQDHKLPSQRNSEVVKDTPVAQVAIPKTGESIDENINQELVPQSKDLSRKIFTQTKPQADRLVASASREVKNEQDMSVSMDTKAINVANDQVTKINDLAQLSPTIQYLPLAPHSYTGNIHMELIEPKSRIRLYPTSDRRIISSLATVLIPSIAKEEIQLLPGNLDDVDIEFLPSYIKNRKIKH